MWIDSVSALEAAVGKFPPAAALKVIDHIDPLAMQWVAASPCLFAMFAGPDCVPAITIGGGGAGFVRTERDALHLPVDQLDDASIARVGDSFGSLFLLPGIGETLRINGRVTANDGLTVSIAVEECYAHCAKALIRSDFWKAVPDDIAFNAVADFVPASRFMAFATMDLAGRADLSPKGDPAGDMVSEADGALWFAERPGNRRTDSQRNMISQPRIAAMLLTPGSTQVVRLTGAAKATADEAIRQRYVVNGKLPALATCIEKHEVELYRSAALERAALWPVRPVTGLDPAKLFVTHVQLNKTKGLGARVASAVISVPGLMRKGLAKDYDTNLY